MSALAELLPEISKAILPPPYSFWPAGDVKRAWFSDRAPFGCTVPRKRSMRAGVHYECKVQKRLCVELPWYVPGPWIRFVSDGAIRYCQPDGLNIDPEFGVITIVEIKYSHTAQAWWQLRRLYEPVIRCMFPQDLWRLRLVEIVHNYDAALCMPEEIPLFARPEDVPVGTLGACMWRI